MTKFVYCVFQEAMRNDFPADAPERAHVWPVLSDSVNTLGGELKEKNKKNVVLQMNGVALHSVYLSLSP